MRRGMIPRRPDNRKAIPDARVSGRCRSQHAHRERLPHSSDSIHHHGVERGPELTLRLGGIIGELTPPESPRYRPTAPRRPTIPSTSTTAHKPCNITHLSHSSWEKQGASPDATGTVQILFTSG
ncbi:hypothetical protein RHA1_ro08568 (plasmid) [Rhodococcus jostii RHA1]|uniref:Uncharacterized protein n=1 Tax=Rhodococcus jostii (strain RHA1) TaxID=101510 RepID=Q0RYM4_RHOJR|nr:hypothetical protein RHA1_ro08568 [Rhodococcus jostii RHA1]